MAILKRSREDGQVEALAMANCLMLLSRVGERAGTGAGGRVFTCKTCNREFPSFQALGGHRASHKKPRLNSGDHLQIQTPASSPAKPKTHECSICGQEFAIGQALGGHMRRHRAVMNDGSPSSTTTSATISDLSAPEMVPVLKKSNSSKRVLCLDLNLTPFENDAKFGNVTTMLLLA
ncbi:hypothetical protein NMG60_11033962 [Bertholletia excelsa]